MRIDKYEVLREALMDYYGTAKASNPMAMVDVSQIEFMSDEELVELARKLKNELGLDDDDIEDVTDIDDDTHVYRKDF